MSKDQAGLHLAAVPPGFVLAECPSPFIRDPKAKNGTTDTENAVFCRFGCCMPCPAQDLVNQLYYMKTRLPVISFYFACISFLMKDGLNMASLQLTLFVLYQQLRHSSFWSATWYFPTKGGEYKKEGLNKNGKLLLTRKCIDILHCWFWTLHWPSFCSAWLSSFQLVIQSDCNVQEISILPTWIIMPCAVHRVLF